MPTSSPRRVGRRRARSASFDGTDRRLLRSLLAVPGSTRDVRRRPGDLEGDGPRARSSTATGPVVKVFDARRRDAALVLRLRPRRPGGDVERRAVGDTDGDGHAELVTVPGAGTPAYVRVFASSTCPRRSSPAIRAPRWARPSPAGDGRDRASAAAPRSASSMGDGTTLATRSLFDARFGLTSGAALGGRVWTRAASLLGRNDDLCRARTVRAAPAGPATTSGYETPSPIQEQAIPPLLRGPRRDRPGPDRHRQDGRLRAAAAGVRRPDRGRRPGARADPDARALHPGHAGAARVRRAQGHRPRRRVRRRADPHPAGAAAPGRAGRRRHRRARARPDQPPLAGAALVPLHRARRGRRDARPRLPRGRREDPLARARQPPDRALQRDDAERDPPRSPSATCTTR